MMRGPGRAGRAGLVVIWSAIVMTMNACGGDERYRAASETTGGDPARGKLAIERYGCGGCHNIPGIATARSHVGPPLTAMAARMYVAGEITNTPANMESWILHPRAIEPHTAMPDTGVTDIDARDITAYLYTLR
jgi:cytochrome c